MAILDDLISYWKLDEDSGTIVDTHGTNNITAAGGVTQGEDGKLNKSCLFDGVDGNIYSEADESLQVTNALSISCWIKPAEGQEKHYDGDSGNYGILGSADGVATTSNWSYQLRYGSSEENPNLGFQLNTNLGARWVNLNESLTPGTWYHIVITYDGTTLKFYLNGVLKDENTIGASTITVNEGNMFIMGCAGWGNSNTYYTGNIDEIGIWNKSLILSEILQLYNSDDGIEYYFIFYDDFDDNDLNIDKWIESTNVGSLVAEQNDRLELISDASVSGFIRSVNSYDLRNKQLILKVNQASTDAGIKFCPTIVIDHIWDVYSESNWYNYQLLSGILSPNKKYDGGSITQVGGDSPGLTPPYWIRIRISNTTIYFDYAEQVNKPTENEWTNISSETWEMGTGIDQKQYIYFSSYNTPTTGESHLNYFSLENYATNIKINIGDIWEDVDNIQIHIGETWKDVTGVKQNIGDTWKTVF